MLGFEEISFCGDWNFTIYDAKYEDMICCF
jgi:hypothetical protein